MAGPEKAGKCPEGFVYIPGGTFKMGSTKGERDEQPVRNISVSGFCMHRYEVTNKKYEEKVPGHKRWEDSNGNDQPVAYVSWYMADEYCKLIGGRLPTEAEWEYAATVGGKYEYGTESGELKKDEGCYKTSFWTRIGKACDVDAYPPNEFGLYGMTGNVSEWVNDWYSKSAYQNMSAKDPTGPVNGDWKVLRGGSYHEHYGWSSHLRATSRGGDRPDARDYAGGGIRCVAPPR